MDPFYRQPNFFCLFRNSFQTILSLLKMFFPEKPQHVYLIEEKKTFSFSIVFW